MDAVPTWVRHVPASRLAAAVSSVGSSLNGCGISPVGGGGGRNAELNGRVEGDFSGIEGAGNSVTVNSMVKWCFRIAKYRISV